MRVWNQHPRTQRVFAYLAAALALALALGQPGRVGRAETAKKSARALAPVFKAQAQPSTDPSVSGRWELQDGQLVREWPLTPVHINLLPDGRVLFWSRDRYCPDYYDIEGATRASVWDPEYKTFKPVNLFPPNYTPPGPCPAGASPAPTPFVRPTPAETNLFCSGHSFLPDGRLLVTGGHNIDPDNRAEEGLGSKRSNIFDYRTDTWSDGPDMKNGRWYPFNVTLGSGETLVASGSYWDSEQGRKRQNDTPEIFTLQGGWRDFSPAQSTPGIDNGQQLRNYPFLHLLPDGRVLAVGNGELATSYLTPSPNPAGGTWQVGPTYRTFHLNVSGGSSVQYAPGKVMLLGGPGAAQPNNASEEKVEVADFNQPAPAFRYTNPLNFPRKYPTSTVLPDGKVLVTGGTSCFGSNDLDCGPNGTYGGAVKNPELWNPSTETWEVMAAQQEARVYHSVALLLPDARVLVAGGGLPGAEGEFQPDASGVNRRSFQHRGAEIFSPPYLFSEGQPATRPVITHAPKDVAFGQSFEVGVGTVKPSEVAQAVLIRLGSVTHAFNQDQRRVALNIAQASDADNSLTLSAPANGNACPPGHYMLFLLKSNGANLTPSVAKIVRVGKVATAPASHAFAANGGTRQVTVSAPSGTAWTATATGGFINLSPPSGTGGGTLNYTVAANTTGSERGGEITVRVTGQPVFDHVIKVYQGKAFADVAPSDAAYVNTGKLSALKITSGCNDGTTFCPASKVTRAQMAIFFVRAILGPGVAPPPTSKQTFSDVPANDLSYLFVEEFVRRGITRGCTPDGTLFCPGGEVSRGELATFAVRALGVRPRTPALPTYADVPANHAFYSFIEEATARGLMPPLAYCPGTGGYGNDGAGPYFSPDCKVTRAEMADLLVKLFRL